MSGTQETEPSDDDWAAAKSILPCGKLSGDDPDDVSALAYKFAEHRVKYSRGIPTAALDGEAKGVIDLLRECLPIVNEYRAWKQADLSGLVDRIDAALAAGEGR